MDDSVYTEVLDAIKNRSIWEQDNAKWEKLRFTGIRRNKKPYPGAPDTHYALADELIEKLKPFYAQQIFPEERVATFVSQNAQSRELTAMAEQWFDYQLKERSNFESATMIGVDTHLEAGICPIKTYWNTKKKQLAFDPVDPLYVIVPQWTEELQDADWLVHVLVMSREEYNRNKNYLNQSDDFLDSISGRGQGERMVSNVKEQERYQRQGLTYAAEKSQVVLWEAYTRTGANLDKWQVETISPVLGPETPIRAAMGLPFAHGELPFVGLRFDCCQKGWYSSRGIPAILFQHELMLCKNWNSQLQHLDYHGQPTYSNDSLTPGNTRNIDTGPGAILPQGIKPNVNPDAPIDFEKQMQFVRALAEARIAIPDLGSSEHLAGPQTGDKTATQVRAVIGLTGQSNDLRSRMFRSQMARIYRQSWSILSQYAGDQLQFMYGQEAQGLPKEALQDSYTITPSGSADSWDVSQRMQEVDNTYLQLFGKPNVNQDELLKWKLENGKWPRLVKRLFQDTQQQSSLQGEKQANELGTMLNGYPIQVKPDDNHGVHIQTGDGFIQRRMQTGEPLTPEFVQLWLKHRQDHVTGAKQTKDPQAPLYQKEQNQMMQMVQKLAMQQQQQGPQPTSPGVMQQAGAQAGGGMPPMGSPAQGQLAAPPQGGAGGQQNQAPQVAQALASLMKAGAHVGLDDVNAALVKMGLPPLATEVAPPAQSLNVAKAIADAAKPPPKPQMPAKGV
jgi:hypothetical protein